MTYALSPELWRTAGLVVGVVIGSAWGVAMTWTVVYLARRDAERAQLERASADRAADAAALTDREEDGP